MRSISNPHLAQLFMQMRFATEKQRAKQLDAAEKLLSLLTPEKNYPFEFVCFHITGFRPKNAGGQDLINGAELQKDLHAFISGLSARVPLQAAKQKEKIYTIDELAKHFGVATKTINRWRKHGLVAKKYIFDAGYKKFGFARSSVEAFAAVNKAVIERARNFSQLNDQEKQLIIKRAGALSGENTVSRRKIIQQIAAETGRAVETVRYTVVNFLNSHPDKKMFKKPPGVVGPKESATIYRMFTQNINIREIMMKFNRSKSSIYRIINVRRARKILSEPIEYISSDEFFQKDAQQRILAKPSNLPQKKVAAPFLSIESRDSLEKYVENLKGTSLLNREQEVDLFRRYNFLKYMASAARAQIQPNKVSSRQLRNVESYLLQADDVKNRIIEANLRLVISIAGKHSAATGSMADLVSEGNLSLMRAVEKFDYTRGFRFSTYASWAIAKDYAHKIPAEAHRLDRAKAVEFTDVQKDMRTEGLVGVVAIENARRSLTQVIKDNLDEREQHIIFNHFGLLGAGVRKHAQSLKQIGDQLGLSKERVRQIELEALQKLRHSLSPEEFELLTG